MKPATVFLGDRTEAAMPRRHGTPGVDAGGGEG